jgi:hypothetical protein
MSYSDLMKSYIPTIKLKQVWDVVSLVRHVLGSWKMQPWIQLDTKRAVDETRRLQKLVGRTLKPFARKWSVFKSLNQDLKNMSTVQFSIPVFFANLTSVLVRLPL